VQLGAVRCRKGHVGQHVSLRVVHQGCELRHLGAELVGDAAPLLFGRLGVILGEGRGDQGGDDAPATLAGVGQRVAHEVDATPLAAGTEHFGGCRL